MFKLFKIDIIFEINFLQDYFSEIVLLLVRKRIAKGLAKRYNIVKTINYPILRKINLTSITNPTNCS